MSERLNLRVFSFTDPPRPKVGSAPTQEGSGPRDDFYCWAFKVWYPSEDCRYRHVNRTYPACTGCFQGRLNLRALEKGDPPPRIGSGVAFPRS